MFPTPVSRIPPHHVIDVGEFVSLRQITEQAMGTTNLTVKIGRDSISYTRKKEPEED